MILYSAVAKSFFWIFMGLAYVLIIAGSPIIAQDLGLSMNWWKWLLTTLWYILLCVGICGGFTMMGEKEPGAGKNFLITTAVSMSVLGVGLWCILSLV
jgi:hypothetical protein